MDCEIQAVSRQKVVLKIQTPTPGAQRDPPIKQDKNGEQTTQAPQESNAHTTSSSKPNQEGRNNWNKKGNHTNIANKPSDVPATTKDQRTVKRNRRPRKNALVPKQGKLINSLAHTAKKHGHITRGVTTLRITKDTRCCLPIHKEGDNIDSQIVALRWDQGINKKTDDNFAERHPCANKPVAIKQ